MIIAALLIIALVYFVFTSLNASTSSSADEAIATDIDMALSTSPVVIKGLVTDNGSASGTEYTVEVTDVFKGELKAADRIRVVIGGKKNNPRATLHKNEHYLFAVAPSSSGQSKYYGLIEPFIFQLQNDTLIAINNEEKYKSAFKESKMTEEELLAKLQNLP
ncbi:hypothetical protein [Paenibacillus sp. GCM10027626]|uniref:hypothetical protein n=1 Tax=Paenibacillus sp. GCM10027626 TaxID=3273411 RepID=UPI00364143FA